MRNVSYWLLAVSLLCLLPTQAAKRRVHIIGDSTMSEYKPAATPKRGWGMYLQAFFNTDSVEVINRAKSGASTRTFYESEALWPSVKEQFRSGDYLIIQFAHNDEKCKGEDVYVQNADLRAAGLDTLTDMRGTEPNTTYKKYLFQFINEARGYGVTPILMSPVCRAYFLPDGTINEEGRHKLAGTKVLSSAEAAKVLRTKGMFDKDYVRCMREVAEDMWAPFLDMTTASQELFETMGQRYCMERYFNCGDKTHTGQEGGMAVATLAYNLINQAPELTELKSWTHFPAVEAYAAYARNIEESGKKAAFAAKGTPFKQTLKAGEVRNMKLHKHGYIPLSGAWPAGEIDEVANRYVQFTIAADKKKGLVIESLVVPVCARGGKGMNIHINYGFGTDFRNVTTLYENTAMPKDKPFLVTLDQPILVPAGEILHLRILPWYDSNGKPQKDKRLELGDIQVKGKRLK